MMTSVTSSNLQVVEEKVGQAASILAELEIDLWLTFVRESATQHDPCLDLIVGADVTWLSAFMLSREGDSIALVGNLDRHHIEEVTPYREVISYVADLRPDLLKTLDRLKPHTIAINFSENNVMADGLSHGMRLLLGKLLEGTPYESQLVSAEGVVSALRGRKSTRERERIQEAIRRTEKIFDQVTAFLEPGQSEREIAAFVKGQMDELGLEPAWEALMCPSVFTGPNSAGAHAGPSDRKVEPGHLLNMDLGVKHKGYCSDLQRTWYIRREGEESAPPAVVHGFETIRDSVQKASHALKPGALGKELDDVARGHITENGYDEYPHALGHQVGRQAHDGGAILGPCWERYGDLPEIPLENDQIYTIEPRLTVEGHGIATLEEIAVVTEDGGKFLSNPQMRLWLI